MQTSLASATGVSPWVSTFAHTIQACRRVDTYPFCEGGKDLHHEGNGRFQMGKGGMACFGKSTFTAGTLVHGPWCATLDGVEALFRDVLPITIGAAPLGQCHNLPLRTRILLCGGA